MSRTRMIALSVALIAVIALATWNVIAEDRPVADPTRATLRGIKGVGVLVNSLVPDVERLGLTRDSILNDAELRLRKAGIRVLDNRELLSEPGEPYLYVYIVARLASDGKSIFYCAYSSLRQRVRLERDSEVSCIATTWISPIGSGMESTKDVRAIRDNIGDLVDDFLNAYLAEKQARPSTESR